LVTTPSTVYAIGLSKSFASYTLHVTSLSSSTGELVASVDFPSSIAGGSLGMLTLSSDTATFEPRVVWLEAGTIRSVSLVPYLTEKPTSLKGSYSKIFEIGLQEKGHFIALNTDDTGQVLGLDATNARLKVIWEFEDSVSVYLESHLPHC
jgi:ER membrane protein complex subunit 1